MTDEDGFLATLTANPTDDTTRLVYADWLEERGDPVARAKAVFLRLTCEWTDKLPAGRSPAEQRLQKLAAALPTDWLGVVSKLKIENCAGKKRPGRRMGLLTFDLVCDRRWEDLSPTSDQTVRFCDSCRQTVHYCDTITVARQHAWEGHCIAVDTGIVRRDGDLNPPMMVLGHPSAEYVREREELNRPDPVSARRERQRAERARQERREGTRGRKPLD